MPPFLHSHRVVYSECTLGNHIYYARFLDLFEEARGEFLRSLGMSFLALQEQGLILPVLEADVRYAAPVRYDELVVVEVRPCLLGRVRLEFHYRVLGTGPRPDVRVSGRTLHVATSLAERPVRIPPALLNALAPFASPAEGSPALTTSAPEIPSPPTPQSAATPPPGIPHP